MKASFEKEVKAMRAINCALDKLDNESRGRVMGYVLDTENERIRNERNRIIPIVCSERERAEKDQADVGECC